MPLKERWKGESGQGVLREVAARLVCEREAHSAHHVLRARDFAFSRAHEMVDAKMGWWLTAALAIQSAHSLPKIPLCPGIQMSSMSKGFEVRRRLCYQRDGGIGWMRLGLGAQW